jgi:hypothetical protein
MHGVWAIAFVLIGTGSFAQVIQNRPDKAVMESYDFTGKPFSSSARNKAEGSPYLNPAWGSGTVYFQNGKKTLPIEVQFDLQKNQLIFRQDGKVMGFAEPIRAFRIIYVFEDSLRDEYFRNGYPEGNNRSTGYFYQVLEDGGKYQFLADRSKQLVDAYTYLGGEKNSYKNLVDFYLFDSSSHSMHRIRSNKKQPIEADARLRSRITDISRDSSLNLKNPEEWRKVVRGLNQ